jgi:hypothetical protein
MTAVRVAFLRYSLLPLRSQLHGVYSMTLHVGAGGAYSLQKRGIVFWKTVLKDGCGRGLRGKSGNQLAPLHHLPTGLRQGHPHLIGAGLT